jgi:hypothetical protein
MAASASLVYKPPEQLNISGSGAADNWRRFKDQWDNYLVAAEQELVCSTLTE